MKMIFVLMVGVCMHAFAHVSAQSVTISKKNVSLEEVFDAVQQQTGYFFWYNTELVRRTGKVDIDVQSASVTDLLEICLKDKPLWYTISGKTIVIKRKRVFVEEQPAPKENIKGKVTAAGGPPLSGVTVKEKDVANGTLTNENGEFELKNVSPGATLVFSYIGYDTRETTLTGSDFLLVNLTPSLSGLDAVVVVGYGTQKRGDVTGAISSVSSKALREVAVTNVQQMLQGRVPGVYVNNTGNKPGSQPSVLIRGVRSFSAGNDPLYVVDGIPLSGGLNDINPDDIESIDVLKDASATAIYGSRGANGVLIITTRRGKPGPAVVSYNSYLNISDVSRKANMMNGPQFAAYRREANRAVGRYNDADPNADEKIFDKGELAAIANGSTTDYQQLILRTGIAQNHELSVSGGNDNTLFNISLGYFSDKGYIRIQDFTRYTTRINIDQKIGRRIKAGMSTLGTFSVSDGIDVNPFYAALTTSPLSAAFDSTGKINMRPSSDQLQVNPMVDLEPGAVVNRNKRFRILSSIYGEADLAPGLKFRMNFAPDLTESRTGNYRGATSTFQNVAAPAANNSETFTLSYTWENMLTYNKVFARKHKLNVTGLYSLQNFNSESSSGSVKDLPTGLDSILYYNVGAGATITGIGSGYNRWSILSWMGRVNYAFDDRFLLTLTGRADGSSKFAGKNKWGFFPAVALGWNISNEDFFSKKNWLNNLKLRLSYGQNGNAGIDPYQTRALLSRTSYDWDGVAAFGYRPASLSNGSLRWETTRSANAGLDFGVLNNRITGTVDVYQSKTTDLLLPRLLPITSGYATITSNVGSTSNSGIEFAVSSVNIEAKKEGGFEWSTDFNMAYNKEKILSLSQGKVDDIGNARFIGEPLGVYFDYVKTGIWQTGEEQQAAQYSSAVGQIKVSDLNNSKKIDAGDRIILGQVRPKWTGGITSRFSYRGFDLSVFLNGAFGHLVKDPLRSGNTFALEGRYNTVNVDYWTPDNPVNTYPRPRAGQGQGPVFGSTLTYFKGDYLRIKNINLGYRLPGSTLKHAGIQSFRIYANVQNPYVFSSFVHKDQGIDPEILSQPFYVNYVFGINLTF
ncbi:TonB-dependent receptor [Chitinophaga ginsengisegetis]|uniref:TonB-dependent receptor n=1 Tax=Chitinophaga ginsengisegetis TaxID=393003 RepID=UPI000DBF3DDC|nr:TonB-dependent receptor [Chitinophaga ginsengisegetis]MDR6567529.1 TonB-linked SusC/RagA family outer membrane protein [Chitinophaga ginsengisegetis]MDR6647916.1 TonB-linked SusC/RagA family outer membrane protein [Chitinophaga ginsengisegetis]MDR6654266.1 TonB-linked SusC/RagA family outer membrane protein [Chitinophaga ginsengisegetis]